MIKVMKIRVLGCSGGIGATARTTSLLIDNDILIDAGTGVGDLGMEVLCGIDHVFLTHAHLDHITSLPFFLDTVGDQRDHPVMVYAEAVTIELLQSHLFNGYLWPDFTRIPSPEFPFMRFHPLLPDKTVTLGQRHIRPVPVTHAVPAVGYLMTHGKSSLAFSGDTTETDRFWEVLNHCDNLQHLIIETTFPDEELELSRLSKHLCPQLLVSELSKLRHTVEVYLTHLMPGKEDEIMKQVSSHLPTNTPKRLHAGQEFTL
jgi:cAMP phosphodiesterase